MEGYTPAPDAQTVTITNTGNSSVTLTLPTDTNYAITTTDSLTLAPSGTAVVSIQPKTGLAVGAYNATLTFATDHSTSDSVDVSFTVLASQYTITASPEDKTFASATVGYTPPASQTITIANTGNRILTLNQPSSTAYAVSALSRTVLNPGDTATFTVAPSAGLGIGTYAETITVTGTGSAQAGTAVSFTVLAAEYSVSGGTQYLLGGTGELVFTSNGAFANFTGVTVDGAPLNTSQYGAHEGSTVVTLYNSYLRSLSAGSHTLEMQFTDGYARAAFTVAKSPDMPDTGDSRPIALYAILAVLCLAALIAASRRRIS